MKWYNPVSWFSDSESKLNPAQQLISFEQGVNIGSDAKLSYLAAFEKLESVNRGVSMIVNAAASLDYDIKDKVIEGTVNGTKQKALFNLLNHRPNPYQSSIDFKMSLFTDFLLEGNIFIYYDGAFLYHLPAHNVFINTDQKTFIASYTYNGTITFRPDEVIHIRDLSSSSVYRGSSRLESANRSIDTLYKMQSFQEQFFENGATGGLILTTDNTLSPIAKEKTIAGWVQRYSHKSGARRPMILDSGLKPHPLSNMNFQEMDFAASIVAHDEKILKALGVPPILLDGGNNANISPNLRLFYLETVMPIVTNFVSAMERYFGYDISAITSNVSALQPELREISQYFTTLVNGGVLTPNEARVELRYEKDKDPSSDKLRIPANIAGSAADPSQGGAPKATPKE
jgi:HK97 family phage portal protein